MPGSRSGTHILEFLDTWTTVDDLKDILFNLNLPRSGRKDELLARISDSPEVSSLGIIVLLNNETLQNALRANGLSTSGRKSELVLRMAENRIILLSEDDILSFLEPLNMEEFDTYHELLLRITAPTEVDRVSSLLGKATEAQLPVFSRVFRSASDSKEVARALVQKIIRGSGSAPCFAAYLIEDVIERSGTLNPFASLFEGVSDKLAARQRRIGKSFRKHPHLSHPAVDSLLEKSWSGETAEKSGLLKSIREEVQSGTHKLERRVQSLQNPSQAQTLEAVSRRTARIESKADDIRRDVRTLHEQIQIVQRRVEESPERVAAALDQLSKTKEIKWGTRRKIKRDLRRFWTLTDRIQKIEFLGRAIVTYGPIVISALRGLL